uniref:Uncharacterized protein n=1 Tax=Panagrolaimus sp. ES5 TaxID=591445 RepID=A0AC34GHH3_9BILA
MQRVVLDSNMIRPWGKGFVHINATKRRAMGDALRDFDAKQLIAFCYTRNITVAAAIQSSPNFLHPMVIASFWLAALKNENVRGKQLDSTAKEIKMLEAEKKVQYIAGPFPQSTMFQLFEFESRKCDQSEELM